MGIRSERDRNIREYVNDATENLLEKLTNRNELNEIEALQCLGILERRFVELERVALVIAVAQGYTLQQCADALGVSRQTIDTKFGKALRPIKQARKEAEKEFKKIWIEPDLDDDGKITWKYSKGDISVLGYTENMLDADHSLREQIRNNPEDYEAICNRAMKRGVLPPYGIEQIRQSAQRYLKYRNGGDKLPGETDKEFQDRRGSEWMEGMALFWHSAKNDKQALEEVPLDEEELDKIKLKMATENHKYLVAWEIFKEEEKAEGRIPTKKALADRMGMNRSTLSRKINDEMRRLTYSRTFVEKGNEHNPKR